MTVSGFLILLKFMPNFGIIKRKISNQPLGRFAQADTVVPGGVQGYDRYAYVNNSPILYVDPAGNKPCWANNRYSCNFTGDDIQGLLQSVGGINFLNNILKETNTTVILACGQGLDESCNGNFSDYGNVQPLYYYSHGLSNIKYFGSGGQSLGDYEAGIENYMLDNSGSNFILVGHSLGADAVLGAADMIGGKEGYGHIKGVMLLDPGGGVNNYLNNGYISDLTGNKVPVAVFNSPNYQCRADECLSNLWNLKNGFNPTAILPPNSVLAPNATSHYDLAVNPNAFLQSGPIFYSWILTLGQ